MTRHETHPKNAHFHGCLYHGNVRFLGADEIANLRHFALLKDYIAEKERALQRYNAMLGSGADANVNARRLTNIGTFRAYVVNFLRASEHINQDMTMLVRQLEPGPTGLPIQIYAFTNDTAWLSYENIQADIFDHLIAILPQFGLSVFQEPSGRDLAKLSIAEKQ